MNNPYRARPSRSRPDPAAVLNYGVQNQNSWGSVSNIGPQSIPSTGGFQGQHQITNQPKQGGEGDPWDWGTENVDNGNDSWNWSVDQQAETQQQLPQQLPQQQQMPQQQHLAQQQQQLQQPPQQFVPSYPNNMQTPQKPQQDNYYQNLNGNNRQMPPSQAHQLEGNTTKNIPSREPTPQQPDNYSNYSNYSANQQQPLLGRPGPTKVSNPLSGNEHSQWSTTQQPHTQVVDNPDRQIPAFNPYFQTNPPNFESKSLAAAIPTQQPLPNNYNWNPEPNRTPQPPTNWQNQTEAPNTGYWHDRPSNEPDHRYKSQPEVAQWQPRHPQTPQSFAANPTTNQWQQQNANRDPEPISQRQPSRDSSVNNTPPGPNMWNQGKGLTSSQSWQQMPAQSETSSGQWSQQHSVDSTGTATDIASEEDMPAGRISSKEWSQVKPPLAHFASSTASTTSGSIPNLSSSADPTDDRKKSLATSVASSTSLNDSPTEGKAPISYQSPSTTWIGASETNSTSDNSENVVARDTNHHENLDWNTDSDWMNSRPFTDLSASVSQLSLGSDKSSQQQHEILHSNAPASQSMSPEELGPGVQTVGRTSQEHVPIQAHFEPTSPEIPAHPPYPSNPPTSLPESVIPQTNYEQWYNQNSPQSQQQIASGWYANDRPRLPVQSQPQQQWNPDQNVENYENIQQSTDFVNLEVVTPVTQERDIYGSRDSINRETLENDQKPVVNTSKENSTIPRDTRQEASNVEIPQIIQQSEQQAPENYEFASNDRNTFLETGELTDSHQEHESTPPSQDDENDEVPNDIPFLREVPGQSSSGEAHRNRDDPTGQEQQIQSSPRVVADPRRNDPTGQAQILPPRNLPERTERRDVPPGQERNSSGLPRSDNDTLERRNDPSGRERSLPPSQSRNDPSGEERAQSTQSVVLETSELREIPGSGTTAEESTIPNDSAIRLIPGGASPNEAGQIADERNNARVVTGSTEVGLSVLSTTHQEQPAESRSKREEAVGASVGETPSVLGPPNRRDSYEDGDDEGSGNSRDGSRERRRDGSPTDRRRYDYDRKGPYYDREREYDDDYYYDRRRGADYDRAYNSREDLDRRDASYREGDRRQNSRDDLDRHAREDPERRGRPKEDLDESDGRRRVDDRRRGDRLDDPRRRDREGREFDSRYPRIDPRDREYPERRRDERRPRRYDDYDPRDPRDPPSRRDYYEDPYARSSRPSSRSSYNDRDRDYYMRARDPYYGYPGYNGYDYGANYNANYFSYLENLRRTNPAAYSEWYHKYYANQHQPQVARAVSTNYQEDRASVHSGRSSCEDRLFANPSFCFHAPNKSLYVSYFGYPGYLESPLRRRRSNCRYSDRTTTSEKRTFGDLSVLEDSRIASSRLTPTKFSTSHVIGSLSIGSLLHVHACYPADGDRAKVDVLRLDYHLLHDPIARELRAYPGPLIKGVTHKKTIIDYCESKIKKAAVSDELDDKASYILLYELMIMLIQQNGNVVGVDIAELLLVNKKNYPYNVNKGSHEPIRRESTVSQRSGGTGGDGSVHEGSPGQEVVETVKQRKTVEQMTDEFRTTLLYGLVQEALEYAMTEGLWGHALFLASKLDKRTHASVMTRFANSLPAQDPLQTLYQLHSGRVPASVTCMSDPKWDDWRPHLAMIISNTSANPEINRRSITNLGDTLASRGDIHAAHFCYILAQLDFGPYGSPGVKLVLIGSNHQRPYEEFVTPEAIMLTEIYEYARNLSEPGFTIVDLQTFKFESARKMVDYGLMEKALLYLEQIAVNIVNDPSKYKPSFINDVYALGDRIKYHDPVCKDSLEDAASLVWLNNLAQVLDRCQTGEIVQQEYDNRRGPDTHENFSSAEQDNREIAQPRGIGRMETNNYNEGPTSLMEVPSAELQQTDWQPLSLPSNVQEQYTSVDQTSHYPVSNVDNSHYNQPQKPDYWSQPNYGQQDYQSQDYNNTDWQQQSTNQSQYPNEQTDVDSSQQQQPTWNYEPAPTISMVPSSGKQYDPLKELEALETPREASKTSSDSKKSVDKSAEKKNANAGGSWFGGFFSKLTPKPKNQMILPDDSNPTIVWDPVAKKWTNKDESGNDGSSTSLAPPPTAADMGFRSSLPETQIAPPQQQPQEQQQQIPQLNSILDQTTPINTTKLVTGSNNRFKLPKGRNMRANYIDVMNPGGTKPTVTNASMPTPATSPIVPMATSSPQLFIPAPVNDPAAPVDFLTPAPVPGVPGVPGDNNSQAGPMMYNPTDVKDGSLKNAARSRYPPR